MLNYELLFAKNVEKDNYKIKYNQTKKAFVKKYTNIVITSKQIFEIISFLNSLNRAYKNNNVPILIELEQVTFFDKLAYIIFECIAYYYKIILKKNLKIIFNIKHTIWTEGIRYSSLLNYSDINEFDRKFKFEIYKRHYRKLLVYNKYIRENDSLSKLSGDIKNFMINNEVTNNTADELSEVLIELIGNGIEHSKADTLIDIDITDSLYGKEENNDNYYGINVAIVTVSNICFCDLLKNKLLNKKTDYGERYNIVEEAYKQHTRFFNDVYKEDDFYIIASFQDSISGDEKKYNDVGGKGLTRLLKSIEDRADSHLCYMLSGNRILFLRKEFLNSKNTFIGFNLSGDFLNEPPSKDIIGICDTYISGVLYNLSFAIKKE